METNYNNGADIMAAQRQLEKMQAAIKKHTRTKGSKLVLLNDMQQYLLEHVHRHWQALPTPEPEQLELFGQLPDIEPQPSLWEQLLAMADAGKDYGIDKSMYHAIALEAIATTYGLERGMDTYYFPSIRKIAEFTGTPYPELLKYYIDNYGETNYGKNTTNYETARR